jgi:hypothetical protein
MLVLIDPESILIHTIPSQAIMFYLCIGIDDELLEKTASVMENLEGTSPSMEAMGVVCGL